MRGLVPCVCVMAAGCDSLFNLDHVDLQQGDGGTDAMADGATDARVDGPEPIPPCLSFSPRANLQNGLTGSHDPTLSRDRLELFTTRQPVSTFELYRSTRTNTLTQFAIGVPVAELNDPSSDDTDPALTADGLMIVFKSNRPNAGATYHAFQATRAAVGAPFNTPIALPGLASQAVVGIDLSPDGLTVYIYTGSTLLQATRPTRNDPFGVPLALANYGAYPSMAPDQLSLFYNSSGVVRRTRATTSSAFGSVVESVDGGGGDADMLSDGTAIVFTTGTSSDVVVIRECM